MKDGMTIPILSLLFPIILAIHNADEYFRYDEFVRVYHSRLAARFVSRPVVRNATVLLTLTVGVICLLTWFYRNHMMTEIFLVASFALMLNAVSHIVVSCKQRSLTPGTLSAVGLVLPYSFAVIATLRLQAGMTWISMLRLAALGLLTVPAAIALFLGLGYTVACLANPRAA